MKNCVAATLVSENTYDLFKKYLNPYAIRMYSCGIFLLLIFGVFQGHVYENMSKGLNHFSVLKKP